MRPAPREKPPQISPIFIADTVTLHVSREKDGKLRLSYAGMDDMKVVPPDGCGQAREDLVNSRKRYKKLAAEIGEE